MTKVGSSGLWVAVAGMVAALGGAGCSAAKCSPSNCPVGCCDPAGFCQSGAANNACGASGAACQACGNGQVCQNALCVAVSGGCTPACSAGQTCVNGQCQANGTDAGGTDAGNGTDGGSSSDGGFPCGTGPHCNAPNVCCADNSTGNLTVSCVSSCAGGPSDTISCASPTDCTPGSPFCCGVELLDGGTPPNCGLAALGTSCTSTCTTHFASSTCDQNTVILCNVGTDCSSDPTNNLCCTAMMSGASLRFCMSSVVSVLIGATGCN